MGSGCGRPWRAVEGRGRPWKAMDGSVAAWCSARLIACVSVCDLEMRRRRSPSTLHATESPAEREPLSRLPTCSTYLQEGSRRAPRRLEGLEGLPACSTHPPKDWTDETRKVAPPPASTSEPTSGTCPPA